MARRVDVLRPRELREASSEVELEALTRWQAMRLLERAQPDDPPRRISGAGIAVIGCFVVGLVLWALSALGGQR